MQFQETSIKKAFVIDIEEKTDFRGFFTRAFCANEFEQHGLNSRVAQCNLCFNSTRGTVRGMHYQVAPAAETKLIRCVRGAIYDVVVDLVPESETYLQHIAVELTADNRRAMYVPEMCAHGYQTLTDEAEIMYLVSEFYAPACERGIRYDDPKLGLKWPLPVSLVSKKDQSWPLWDSKQQHK